MQRQYPLTAMSDRRIVLLGALAMLALAVCAWSSSIHPAHAQDGASASPSADTGETSGESGGGREAPAGDDSSEGSNFFYLFELLYSGGIFMIPILLLSMVVVTLIIERFLALRRDRILPGALIQGIGRLSGPQGFDPRQAYRICQEHPSTASSIVRVMLLKVGRPHSEVEHAVAEASDREANRLYGNVSWLTLAGALAPLLGLLGTVWGMIEAFRMITELQPGDDRAEQLASGIYQAMVTTLTGLVVAIVAVVFAHLFERRIQRLFFQVDEMVFNLLPQVERFEGRVRFNRQLGEGEAPPADSAAAPVAAEPVGPPAK